LITGAIVLSVSIAVMVSVWPSWVATLDPDENHLVKLEGGENETVNLSTESSYLLFRLDNGAHNCTIIEDATGTEVTIGSPTFLQSDREGVDGEWYYAVGAFIPDGSGEHDVQNNGEDVLWVVDEMDLAANSDSTYITSACLGIIFGVCLLPIAFGLWMNAKKVATKGGLVMQTPGGDIVPIASAGGPVQQRVPTTDEIWRSVHGGEIIDLAIHQQPIEDAPAPFADRPDRIGGMPRVIDEVETVEETTPQVTDDGDNEERNWKAWDEG
jgi:hypothetical protein